MRPLFLSLICGAASLGALKADDWPNWLGHDNASVWSENGIVDRFPDAGLKERFRVPVGLGYAGPAVANGRVFVADYKVQSGDVKNNPGGRPKLNGTERVLCLDATSGKELWQHKYSCNYEISYPGGPRCTPTVDGDRVYTLGAEGNLLCLSVDHGEVIWSRDLKKDYGAETPAWGFSAHPFVHSDRLYCVVGGEGSVVVAFDKHNGEEVWKALSAREPGYCPPSMIVHNGVRQLLVWHPEALNGLNPVTGDVYWSVELKPSYGMSIAIPRKKDNLLFASGIGDVGAIIQLDDAAKPGAKIVWRGNPKNSVYAANVTPIIDGDVIYGCDCEQGSLMAVRMSDGKRLWESRKPTTGTERRARHGTAFLVRHEDRYFLFSETGDLILARLSPEGYEEISRQHILEPTNECFGTRCRLVASRLRRPGHFREE